MGLKEKIEADLKQALKAKNETAVSTLRLFLAALKNAEIEKLKKELTEEELQKLIRSEIKKRKEAAEDYGRGGRADLKVQEEAEVKILERYLPAGIGEEEIKKIILKMIAETKARGPEDFGRVMGRVMKEVGGRAEGSLVGRLVKESLEKIK